VISIRIHNDNPISHYLINKMVGKYLNIYYIGIRDWKDSVDCIHESIKKIVVDSRLSGFGLAFWEGLSDNEEGLKLLKQYNRIIKNS